MVEIGQVLGDRYRLLELLGEGGMATIYRAHDLQLDRDVAVKILRSEYGRDASFVARFRQEAQAAASLTHPNIVGVYDYGTGEAGPFIVMEFVDGEDLAEIIRERGYLPPGAAARIAEQVTAALTAAHARGIVHRDIKPGNVLVTRDGRAKVGDFGIARAFAESELTLPGTTLGSVHYFSPEQARGEPVTAASDIYALGLVLFEMLTGRRPFEGDSASAIAVARLTSDPPAPSTIRPEVPPALDAIVRKALAREPAARFASAQAFGDALRTFLGARPGQAVAGGPGVVAGPAVAGVTAGRAGTEATVAAAPPAGPGGMDDEYARRPVGAGRREALPPEEGPGRVSPWTWAAAGLGLLILVAAAALVLVFLGSARGPTATPPVEVTAPNLVGRTLEEAQRLAQDAGLAVSVAGTEKTSDKPENTVLSQDPQADRQVPKGSTIKVVIVSGALLVGVPDLRNKPEAEAFAIILDAKLKIGQRTEAFDPTVPGGAVISQSPAASIQVPEGTAVDYVLSKGPEPTPTPTPSPTPSPTPTPTAVPSVTIPPFDGKTGTAYADELSKLGLVPSFNNLGGPPGNKVVSVFPTAGKSVPPGSSVLITTAPSPSPTPTLTPTPPPS